MAVSAVNHGPVALWIGLGVFDLAACVAFGLLARRAQATGQMDRYKRYSQGAWGMLAFAGLLGARILLLTH
ncbi:MAG TPA: hypothetical protein VFL58_12720 [Gaiellaceae bacterium]|nr:hypothetical protein [Gaiellaceae bacterium]